MIQKSGLLLGFLASVGCLQTRNDVKAGEQRQVIQSQVSTIQKTNADTVSRFTDMEEQIRQLNGKIEVVENQVHKGDQQSLVQTKGVSEQVTENNKKMALLQESLFKLEAQLVAVQAEVAGLKAEIASGGAKSAGAAGQKSAKNILDQAQESFSHKDWKKAIVNFSKYREDNPKGKNFAEATYKIGVSFQELGLKEEAKSFYDELIARFPKSEEAKKVKARLKSLK